MASGVQKSEFSEGPYRRPSRARDGPQDGPSIVIAEFLTEPRGLESTLPAERNGDWLRRQRAIASRPSVLRRCLSPCSRSATHRPKGDRHRRRTGSGDSRQPDLPPEPVPVRPRPSRDRTPLAAGPPRYETGDASHIDQANSLHRAEAPIRASGLVARYNGRASGDHSLPSGALRCGNVSIIE